MEIESKQGVQNKPTCRHLSATDYPADARTKGPKSGCAWCNGYRRRKLTRSNPGRSYSSHCANTLGKGMNPTTLSPAMEK